MNSCGPQKFDPGGSERSGSYGSGMISGVMSVLAVVFGLLSDLIRWVGLTLRSQRLKEAEILFLRRQLGLYVERGIKPRRIGVATASQVIASLAGGLIGGARWSSFDRKP
jgi:hypothetical protein